MKNNQIKRKARKYRQASQSKSPQEIQRRVRQSQFIVKAYGEPREQPDLGRIMTATIEHYRQVQSRGGITDPNDLL